MKNNNKFLHTLVICTLLFGLFSPALVLADDIPGTPGNDTLTGTEGSDNISGYEGRDTLNGLGGDDSLFGGGGRDTLNGDAGNDFLYGEGGKDELNGGEGDDLLNGGAGDDDIDGGPGIDTVEAKLNGNQNLELGVSFLDITGPDFLEKDTLESIENASLTGSNDNNKMDATGFSGTVTMDGRDGNDTLTGTDQNDVLLGGDGNDTLNGKGGDDNLFGGDGIDTLNGGKGDDLLDGGKGNDDIDGGKGSDTVLLILDDKKKDIYLSDSQLDGNGLDTLDSIENAFLTGNYKNNEIDARDFTGKTFINGMGGADFLMGGEGKDTLIGGSGDDKLYGNNGNDALFGGSGDDKLYGGDGDDVLIDHIMFPEDGEGDGGDGGDGGPMMMAAIAGLSAFGDDLLVGGDGDDTLVTFGGNDTLKGGQGDDTLVFANMDPEADSIVVEAYGNAGKNIFQFVPGTVGHYILNTTSGKDTLDFSNYDQGVNIDLSLQGEEDEEQLVSTGLWITLNGWFKKLIGTNFGDTLVGNKLNNTIRGLDGDDSLDGGAGINKLNGGNGIDSELNKQLANTRISIELPVDPTAEPTKVPDGETKKEVQDGTGGFFIPVTGGLIQKLACPAGSNEVVLTLESGDQVRFIGLCDLDAVLDKIPEESLPGSIPAGTTFVSDLQINVLEDGKLLELFTSGSIEISFAVPLAFQGKNLALMFWDTESLTWMEIPLDSTELEYPLNLSNEPSDPRLVLKGLSPTVVRAMTQGNFSGLFLLVAK